MCCRILHYNQPLSSRVRSGLETTHSNAGGRHLVPACCYRPQRDLSHGWPRTVPSIHDKNHLELVANYGELRSSSGLEQSTQVCTADGLASAFAFVCLHFLMVGYWSLLEIICSFGLTSTMHCSMPPPNAFMFQLGPTQHQLKFKGIVEIGLGAFYNTEISGSFPLVNYSNEG